MDSAIEFNNYGVALLKNGSYNDAFHMFQGSMGILSQLSSNHAACRPLHVNEEDDRIKLAKMTAMRNEKSYVEQRKLQKGFVPPFLHSKPMPLQVTYEKFNNGNYEDRTEVFQRYSGVVMFNFALTHHLKFFDGPSSHDVLLDRALRLYDMSYDLISENSEGREEDIDYAVAIAIINNKAQIHHESGNYTQSEILLATLRQLAMSLDESFYQKSLVDGNSLILNADLMRQPTMAAAA